jgi:hypothetical protein
MPYCYYTCNLLPLDLVARAGYSPLWLGNYLRDPSAPARRDALSVHPMTCPFATKLVAAAEDVLGERTGAPASGEAPAAVGPSGTECLVVPGGCDAMRRLGDLPRSSGPEVTATLASDLGRLEKWLRARAPGDSRAGSEAAVSPEPPTLDYPRPPRPGGVFVVSGPLSDDSLLGLIDRLGAHVSGLESCTAPDRWKPLAPSSGATSAGSSDTGLSGTPGAADNPWGYEALAADILATGMCPRRSTVDRREHLVRRLDEARPGSIIYARQSFCDPGAYDALLVAQLAQERGLPYLEIEVDFPFDANGPLRTRVEAFLEAQLLDDDLLNTDDLFGDEASLAAGATPAAGAATGAAAAGPGAREA